MPNEVSAAVWVPVVTLVIGFLLAQVADVLRERRTNAQRVAEQERRFQFDTMVELQDALHGMYAEAAMIFTRHEEQWKKSARWMEGALGDELSETGRLARARVTVLRVRLQDSALLGAIDSYRATHTALVAATTREAAVAKLVDFDSRFDELNKRIGELIGHWKT
jgi:hypothetical protein